MIETFTKEQFETYLSQSHTPYKALGLIDGEYSYLLPLDGQASITIRSSVKSDGTSADTGKDSIRAWLVDNAGQPLGSKVSRWTTRKAGWQNRLTKVVKTICQWRSMVGDCPDCGQPKGIFKAKTDKNRGRIFAKCKNHDHFIWLDEIGEDNNAYFAERSHSNGHDSSVETVAHPEPGQQPNDVQPTDTAKLDSDNVVSEPGVCSASVPGVREPNEQQQLAIDAPIDANLRILAPPGSGKTALIEWRYKRLVDAGVDPKKILVVTFSKAMADEMGQRILATCPVAELEQISTIHAFCYRLLCKWDLSSPYYKWQVPKDWRVRKELEDIIGAIWQGEKPGYSEVLGYIDTSKYLGLTVEDSYEWFVEMLGQRFGEWLYEIRSRFDAWLQRNRYVQFADMLYLVERRLRTDSFWREELQRKYSHVIVDESQDTNYQAMRILITISLEVGQNTVYEKEGR